MRDPVEPRLEEEARRRRGRLLFRRRQIPIRLLVPNFFTLVGLAAGLTALRMAYEARYEWALAAIVFAALLDGVDGRVARALKASSRFGAELDSLADFVNFGVAPAVLLFTWTTWGTPELKNLGWIVVLLFAIACALRLARFNAALEEERPRWQTNYFTGVPAPAGALVVLLPLYLDTLGAVRLHAGPGVLFVLGYTLLVAFLMISTIPTYSGKLAGERIAREWVLPLFFAAGGALALLATYPYGTLALATLAYIVLIPVSIARYRRHLAMEAGAKPPVAGVQPAPSPPATPQLPPEGTPPTRH